MGLSQLWNRITGEQGPEAASSPAPAPDHQALYGNAFLGSLFSSEEAETAETGIADAATRTVDRIAARRELEGRFDTSGASTSDGRAAVSEEELDEIVALYSDIRLGRSHLTLDTAGLDEASAEAFRDGAMGDVASMLQTESGRRLLAELAYNEKGMKTSIGRSTGTDGPNSTAYLEGGRDCSESFARDRAGDPIGWCIDDRRRDGKGVDSEVRYRPGEHAPTAEGPSRSDVTLYHELVHALHNVRGDQAGGGVAGPDGRGVDNTEFQATGLGPWEWRVDEHGDLEPTENLYRAERRDLGDDLGDRPTYGGASPH